MSRCNPPCEAGLRCTDAGECEPITPATTTPPASVSPPAVPSGAAQLGACTTPFECRYPESCIEGRCRPNPVHLKQMDAKAQSTITAGWATFSIGLGLAGVGVTLVTLGGARVIDDDVNMPVGYSLMGVGAASLLTSIILLPVGYHRRNMVNAYQTSAWLGRGGGGMLLVGSF